MLPSVPLVRMDPSTRAARRRRRLARIALVGAIGGLLPLASNQVSTAAAPYPAPVMRGYVPLDADATRTMMHNANAAAGTTLDFTVGITNAGAGAVMVYDHWEDGYEADPTNPVQPTTEVWGDGDPTGGDAAAAIRCGVRCTGDQLPAGAVFVLRNTITTPRNAGEIRFDGRDRVSSTRGFITAGGFATNIGSVLSASASSVDTTGWGTDYWAPVGQGMTPPAGTNDSFATASLQVMADQDGTVVEVDEDGDGTVDQTAMLAAGQVLLADGGVFRGAHVTASKPVQVHLGAGDPTTNYELRWFQLFPTARLSADYLNPVGSADDNQRTITYLFNPGATPITVDATSTGGTTPIVVPARGGVSHASPLGAAVRFESQGGETFAAVGASGSESGAAPGSGTDNSGRYDWGFGLVPSRSLTPKAVLGWAPGNSANPPNQAPANAANADDDPVWIAAFAPTTLYIDYDGDPTTGALGPSACGAGLYDEVRTVAALESTRIFDATDGDMTGAAVYTCDGTKIAGAWGEDAANAPAGVPGFDAGSALVPSSTMIVEKGAGLGIDANGDGRFGPGDTIAYDITLIDAGALSLTAVQVVDAVPAGTAYVAGSTTYEVVGGGPAAPFADDAAPASPYPFDGAGAALPATPPGATVHLRYRVQVANPFPAGATITNTVAVTADQASGGAAVATTLLAADLSVTNVLTGTPTYVGDQATFTVTVGNGGPDAAPGVVVNDFLPVGLTFVSATPAQGTYDPATGQWNVGTVPSGTSVALALVARVDVLSATTTAEVVASLAADPDSTPANAPAAEDDLAAAGVTVAPVADLSLTKVLAAGPDALARSTFTLTLANAGPSASGPVTVTDHPPAGATFVGSTPAISAMVDGTFDGTTGAWSVPSIAAGGQARIDVVYATPVAPGTNHAQVSTAGVHDPDSTPSTTPLSDLNPPVEDDEAGAAVPATADLSVTNVVTTGATFVGDVARFTVTVANAGPTGTTGVMVTDLLPAGLAFAGATPSAGTYDPTTGVWNVGALAAGASRTLLLDARVMAPGALTTTAETPPRPPPTRTRRPTTTWPARTTRPTPA